MIAKVWEIETLKHSAVTFQQLDLVSSDKAVFEDIPSYILKEATQCVIEPLTHIVKSKNRNSSKSMQKSKGNTYSQIWQ